MTVSKLSRSGQWTSLLLLLWSAATAEADSQRVFGSTADDVHEGSAGDGDKITIYAGVMSAAGGTLVVLVLARIVYILAKSWRTHQVVTPGDYRSIGIKDVEHGALSSISIAEESKIDPLSATFNAPKAKRKVRIKLAKNGMHSFEVQHYGDQ